MTLKKAQEKIRDLGYKNSPADWEDNNHIYAFSSKGCKGCYGHPKATVHYNKSTKILDIIK